MSQAAVEQILGRLLTDADFRDQFFAGPIDFLLQHYSLSQSELDALSTSKETLTKKQFDLGAASLDAAICRAEIRHPRRPEPSHLRLQH